MIDSSSLAIRKLITNRGHLDIWRNYFGSVKIVVATVSSVEQDALGTVIDYRRYGSLNKLLTATEIEECKTLWILHNQNFIFGKGNFTKVKISLNLFHKDKKYYGSKQGLLE